MKHFSFALFLPLMGVYSSSIYVGDASSSPYFDFHAPNGSVIRIDLREKGPPPATLEEAKEKIQFYLHRNGENSGVEIRTESRQNLDRFFPDAPLFVLCHGFMSNNRDFGGEFLKAFQDLSRRDGNLNVIVINWEDLAKFPFYDSAAHNVGPVGTETACLLRYLIAEKFTSLQRIHFIGHSLGSHVGNHVANAVNSKCGKGEKIARITALDPALPLFHDADDRRRIDEGDAEFVDVIHTSKGLLGFGTPRGQVDFWPNDGASPQPGCPKPAIPGFFPPLVRLAEMIVRLIQEHICSHSRATTLFAESIKNPDAFWACLCKNWKDYNSGACRCLEEVRMGFGASNTTTRGSYYLKTKDKSPFGMGQRARNGKQGEFHLKRGDRKRERVGILAI